MTITQELFAPLIVVVGATGIQGGSVIQALSQSDKPYRIRGITRDAAKPAAQDLTRKGVDMVSVNLVVENRAAVFKVFEGATFVFAVTNFWEHMQKDKEIAEGKMLVDAAKAANVKLLVWSGLENMTEASGGKYTHVDHFDGKAAITAYAKKTNTPTVDVQAGMYMSNYTGPFSQLKKVGEDKYALLSLATPSSTTPLLDTAGDYGLFVRKAIESPTIQSFSAIYAHSEVLTQTEIAKQLAEVTGKNVVYTQISEEGFKKGISELGVPPPIVQELMESYGSHDEFGYFGSHDVAPSKEGLARPLRTWKEFVQATDWRKFFN